MLLKEICFLALAFPGLWTAIMQLLLRKRRVMELAIYIYIYGTACIKIAIILPVNILTEWCTSFPCCITKVMCFKIIILTCIKKYVCIYNIAHPHMQLLIAYIVNSNKLYSYSYRLTILIIKVKKICYRSISIVVNIFSCLAMLTLVIVMPNAYA